MRLSSGERKTTHDLAASYSSPLLADDAVLVDPKTELPDTYYPGVVPCVHHSPPNVVMMETMMKLNQPICQQRRFGQDGDDRLDT